MRRVFSLLGVGLLLIGAASIAAVPQVKQRSTDQVLSKAPKVGHFLVRYARAMRLVGENATPEQALAALRAVGALDSGLFDLSAPLTEGEVIRIAKSMKLGVTTTDPDRAFSESQTDMFFAAFASSLQSGNSALTEGSGSSRGVSSQPTIPHDRNPNAADPTTKGKGKKKGLSAHFPF